MKLHLVKTSHGDYFVRIGNGPTPVRLAMTLKQRARRELVLTERIQIAEEWHQIMTKELDFVQGIPWDTAFKHEHKLMIAETQAWINTAQKQLKLFEYDKKEQDRRRSRMKIAMTAYLAKLKKEQQQLRLSSK